SDSAHRVVVTFSVRPYRLSTAMFGMARRAASTKLPGIGAPAEVQNRMLLASCTSGSYTFSSICRNVVAVTAPVQPNLAMRSSPSRGSQTSMMCDPAPYTSGSRMLVTRPVVWVTGDGPNWTSDAEYSHAAPSSRAPQAMVLKVCRQPLGREGGPGAEPAADGVPGSWPGGQRGPGGGGARGCPRGDQVGVAARAR